MSSLLNKIIRNQRTCLFIDTYNDFHEQHRSSDYEEIASYITLYLIYHYVPLFQNQGLEIKRLIADSPKILVILSGNGGEHNLPNCVDQIEWTSLNMTSISSYDFVINCANHELSPKIKNVIPEDILQSKLGKDTLYLAIKSDRVFKQYQGSDKFDLMMNQSWKKTKAHKNQGYKTSFGQMSFSNTKDSVTIPYGPWPLVHIDFSWRTFPRWPTLGSLKERKKLDKKTE